MNDIPEEIRKMFPDQPIHKLDIDDSGELHVLASADPLSNDPHFENMPTEQVNKYLRDHGYDPERVGLTGKILSEALIENIALLARAEAAERELAELRGLLSYSNVLDCQYCHKWFSINEMYSVDACNEEHQKLLMEMK